jgi:hypothetical protein
MHDKLLHFLGCLDVPAVAQFRDSPVYTDAAEIGSGVVDMKDCRAARKETAQWKQLTQWIDTQTASKKSVALKPRAAERKTADSSARTA